MLMPIPVPRLLFAGMAISALLGGPAIAQTSSSTGVVQPIPLPQPSPLSQPSPQTQIVSPTPNVVAQPNLDSFSERTIQCLNQGSAMALDPNSLSSYMRGCAN